MEMNEMKDKKGEELFLFVWEGVLTDWSSGMAVVLAHDLEEALLLMKKKAGTDLELPISKMKKITKPEAFYVYGGG
jgi:hypothetical protein